MANDVQIADGVYLVGGSETRLQDGAWVSDGCGAYLVADQTKLALIPDARPGDIAFTAGYKKIWQLDTDGETWVETPETSGASSAEEAAESAAAAAASAGEAASSANAAAASATSAGEDAATAQAALAAVPQDYATLTNSVAAVSDALADYGLSAFYRPSVNTNQTKAGVTITINGTTATFSGTTTGNCMQNIYYNENAWPAGMTAGGYYYVDYTSPSRNVQLEIWNASNAGLAKICAVTSPSYFRIPTGSTGLLIRYFISSGHTVNETVTTGSFYRFDSTVGLLASVDTDTSDETGKKDMTPIIQAMLDEKGYCRLGPGIFYVSGNIVMPENSTLEGCGAKTVVRLLSSVSSGFIVRPHTRSTIRGIHFSGSGTAVDYSSSTIGTRNGIALIGNASGTETAVSPASVTWCRILDCWFSNFTGSAIYGHNTGGGLQNGLIISNCTIECCVAGINFDYNVEYSKITNVKTFRCYYACINNGGNNVFTACTFHGTIGFLIDDTNGTATNNSHGSVIGCTFNHIDNWNRQSTLGGGEAIKIINADNGFVFTGCQIWYGTVTITNSRGIMISDTLFGGNTPEITATGSYPVFLNGCIFHATPNLTLTDGSAVTNCYLDTDGSALNDSDATATLAEAKAYLGIS